jgi:penicillin amidase
VRGSNNWAVAGRLTADGGALLANDMHLGTRIPNTWYRASFVWADEEHPALEHRVTGVTLPGAPPIIAGSNGHVAWGFTNSQGDWSDLVLLEIDPANPDSYRTPGGRASMERFEERIEIRGAEPEILEVRWTIWGPVLGEDHLGRLRALRWIAHDPAAVDLGLLRMELAQDVDQAILAAAETRLPAQNCAIADSSGRIAWTLMGPIPRRFGHDGSLPRSWAAGELGWDGLLEPAEYPSVVDPPTGRIWTANNRVVGGEMLRVLGDGGLALGARARQIRDDLMALEGATVRDMLDVQLDDRALFLARWRDLLLETLTDEAVLGDPRRVALRDVLRDGWTGRASIDSAAYRMVRGFRAFLRDDVLSPITARCKAADDGFEVWAVRQWEGPLWSIVTQRPIHLLEPSFSNWDARLLATVDRLLLEFENEDGRPLADYTWGERNTTRIQHPLSIGIPQLSNWLDAPAEPLPGDSGMPRVQGPTFGASERFVVSPGREADGIFHMPGGQSGHFLSPYYMKGHAAWARGEATPFLPGEAAHQLTLTPAP